MADINVARALAVQGWMSEYELEWLARAATSHSVIVELGSFLGRSTCALATHTPGVVYAIDHWLGPSDVWVEDQNCSMRDLNIDLFPTFESNVGDLIASGKIIPIRGDHADLSIIPADLRPDMVFIDGTHDYEDVRRDILTWIARLKPGGLMAGHDIAMDGVFRAVMELFPRNWTMEPLTDIWWTTHA